MVTLYLGSDLFTRVVNKVSITNTAKLKAMYPASNAILCIIGRAQEIKTKRKNLYSPGAVAEYL